MLYERKVMKLKIFAIILIFAMLAACTPSGTTSTEPTPDILATIVAATMQAVTPLAPPPTAMVINVPDSVTMQGSVFAFQNISMSIPVGFATGARGETVPRAEGDAVEPWGIAPQHTRITFDGYALGQRFHEPQIFIYPVDEFAAMSEGAATIIEELRSIANDTNPNFPDTLPHLPIFNAQQLFSAKAERINFGSGRGIRYITQYSQSFAQINNNELFYTFQGITDDGRYYVAANLPITTPLVDTMTAPNFGDPAFTPEQYTTYLDGVAKTLSSLAAPFYAPSLDVYDQLIFSIVIGQ